MRILRQLRADLEAFLSGEEYGLLLLRVAHDHLPWIYMILQEIAATSPDVHLDFPHAFVSATAYADIIAERVAASAREAVGSVARPLPTICNDPAVGAESRVRAALAIARDLLPRGPGAPRLVCTLCPLELHAPAEHDRFVRGVFGLEVAPPWFHRMRVLVHLPPDAREPTLPRMSRALAVDLSSGAMARSVEVEAQDLATPPPQRAQALLQAGTLQIGLQRHDAAALSFHQLRTYAQRAGDPLLTALACHGLGEVERARSRRAEAQAWYERALVPAGEAGVPIVLLMVARALADVYLDAGRHAEAEQFFDGAQQLAAALPEPEAQSQALTGRGRAQALRGASEPSAVSFLAAAKLARRYRCEEQSSLLRSRLKEALRSTLPAPIALEIRQFLGGAP